MYLLDLNMSNIESEALAQECSKAWFPPGDTFLEIEIIKTVATFIPRR